MRKMLCLSAMLLCAGGMMVMAGAEPLLLEQATNTLKPKTLEVGISELSYQSDQVTITDANGAETLKITNTVTSLPLYLKYAFTGDIEGLLQLSNNSVTSKSEAGGASLSSDSSGMGDPVAGVKFALSKGDIQWGAGAMLSLPMGDKKYREGLTTAPFVAARRELGVLSLNAQLSYALTGEYDDDASQQKVNPGDELGLGAGIEYIVPQNKALSLIGEVSYQSFGESSVAGTAVKSSEGARMDINLGMRYQAGNVKTLLGVVVATGEEKYREYDYRVLAGVTYLLQL